MNVAVAWVVLLACATICHADPQEQGTMPEPDLPRIENMSDLQAHAGKRARIEGRYEVAPIAGSKRLQPAVVVLADGTRLLRSYRPLPAEFGFLERRVVVIGRAWTDANQGPDVQQVMAPHVAPDSIALAPGETAWSPVPTELPPPPRVTDRAGHLRHDQRWILLVGRLERLDTKPSEAFWSDAVYRLADGSQVHHATVADSRWRPHLGKTVSVVARAGITGSAQTGRLWLTGMSAICEGVVERCGMPAPAGKLR
jgi:hypothetical protein